MNSSAVIHALVQFVLVTGISFVLLCLLASIIRFYQLSMPGLMQPAEPSAAESPELFLIQVAQRISTAYRTPQPFSLFVITFSDPPAAAAGDDVGKRRLALIKQALRQGDVVCPLADGAMGLLLDIPRAKWALIAQRLGVVLQGAAEQIGAARIGGATCPENGLRGQVLIDLARAALPADTAGWRLAEPTTAIAAAAEAEDDGEPAIEEWVDPLTGVLRQEQVRRVAQRFMSGLRRSGRLVSVIYLDVDHLGRYNKTYGQPTGDGILKDLSALLQRQLRETDLIARCGDDEFLILLDCAPDIAWTVGQRLVGQIKKAPFQGPGQILKVTVSAGVAGYPSHGRTAWQLQQAAHAALQAAREQGRNLCVRYEHTMRPYEERPAAVVDQF